MSPIELDALAKELYAVYKNAMCETFFVSDRFPAVARWVHRRTRLAEREAYEDGMLRGVAQEFCGIEGGMAGLKAAAVRAFPLPSEDAPAPESGRIEKPRKDMDTLTSLRITVCELVDAVNALQSRQEAGQ